MSYYAPPPVVAPIPDQQQQVGLAAGASCSNVDDSQLNRNLGLRGGWAASWAWWVNSGKGGAVCTRILHYDDSKSLWTII